jgi:hypothetical protein
VWDKRRRGIRAGVAVTQATKEGKPTAVTLFVRGATIDLEKWGNLWRVTDRWTSPIPGRIMMEHLASEPELSRPFGRSRITREVRYLTNAALRSLVRAEVSAEFYSSPQRYILGAKEDAFASQDRWSAIMGRILALDLNEEGERPQVGQFTQLTMAPHLEHYRQLAQNFCSTTHLPQSAVGLFADNPTSAEAAQAAEAQLSEDAEYQWRLARAPLRRLLGDIILMRDGQVPSDLWRAEVNWTPARYVSPQASADFAVKAVGADPSLAGTNVLRRRLGLTKGEIDELAAAERRATSGAVLERLLDKASKAAAQTQGTTSEPAAVPLEEEED